MNHQSPCLVYAQQRVYKCYLSTLMSRHVLLFKVCVCVLSLSLCMCVLPPQSTPRLLTALMLNLVQG